MRGTITSWMRWSPSSMTAWIICSSSASRIPCSPPCSMIRRSSSALIRSSAATSAPNSRLMRRVVHVRNADERAEEDAQHVDEPAGREHDPLGVGQADLLRHELAEDDREDRQHARHDHERDQVRRPGERSECPQPGGHPVHQADRRERRRQEAQEVDADLDDRQEAPGLLLEPEHAGGAARALIDELLETAAAQRDQRDLGGREDAVEQDEQDDEGEFEIGVRLGGAAGRRRGRTAADQERHADEGKRRPPRAGDVSHRHRRARVWTVARGSVPGRRPPACRRARRG